MPSFTDIKLGSRITCACGVTIGKKEIETKAMGDEKEIGAKILQGVPWLVEHQGHGGLHFSVDLKFPDGFDVQKTPEWPTLIAAAEQYAGVTNELMPPASSALGAPYVEIATRGDVSHALEILFDDFDTDVSLYTPSEQMPVVVIARNTACATSLLHWFREHEKTHAAGKVDDELPPQ